MIGTKVRSIPSRSLNPSLAFCRKRTTLVMSTSATVQAWGIVCLLFSMLVAIARRMGLSGVVVPGVGADVAAAGADVFRCSPLAVAGWARLATKSSMSFLL